MLIKIILTGKIIKKILRLTILFFVIIITAVFTLFSVFRTPSFQVLAGRLVAAYLSKQLNTEIVMDKFRFTESLFIQLQGLQVNDHQNNKMLRIDDLRVKINQVSLKNNIIRFDQVSIDSGGFFIEKYDGDSLMNFRIFLAVFYPDSLVAPDTTPANIWRVSCNELMINDFSFGLRTDQAEYKPEGINYNNILVSGIFLDIKEIAIIGDSIAAFVDHVSCTEQSGLELLNFSGDARVSSTGIRLEGGQISTGQSSLDLDLDFLYNDYNQLSDFLDSVKVHSTIRSSLVTPGDIGYFAPVMFKMEDPVMISTRVEGPIRDFTASDLNIKIGEFTELKGAISMKGLPDIDSTFFSLNIENFTTTPEDVAEFNLPLEKSNLELPPQVEKMGFTSIQGNYTGFLNDFNFDFDISSDAGEVKILGSLDATDPDGDLFFSGELIGNAINLGSLLDTNELGTVNLELEFDGQGSTLENLNMSVNGWIQDLEFRKYRYDKIIFGGQVAGRSFDGRLVVLDTLLNLGFDGLVDFNGSSPAFNFKVDIEEARLFDLNLSDRSEDANLTGQISVDFRGSNADSFNGIIQINDFNYHENNIDYPLKHLDLTTIKKPGQSDITRLRSDYIDGDIEGKFTLKDLINQLTGFALGKDKDVELRQQMKANPQYLSFDFRLKDISPFTELFLPGIDISPGTVIKGQFDSGKPLLELNGSIGEISVSGIKMRGVSFSGVTALDDFNFDVGAHRVFLQENEDGSGISMDNLLVHIVTADSTLDFSVLWGNEPPQSPNSGALDGFVKFHSMKSFEAGFYNAEANINGNLWHVEKDNLFSMDASNISIRDFQVYKDEESFIIDGNFSNRSEDTLNLYFENWDLRNFNPLLEQVSMEMGGIVNGKFGIFKNEDIINLYAGIHIDDLSLNEVLFGNADFSTHWIESEKALSIDLNLYSEGSAETPYKILGANGIYYPFDKNRNFDFDVTTKNLNISVLEPLLSSFSSHLTGFATGKLTLEGTNDKPLLLGRLKLQRAEMLVDYLNVTYSFSNEVVFTKDMIQFNDLKVYDPKSNTAMLSGGIKHNYFKDMSLDLTIDPVNFMAINLDRYQNEVFYGTAYATGKVKLSGPFENLSIMVDVKTEKDTKVSIPINYSVDVSQNNFIVFTGINDSVKDANDTDIQLVGLSLDMGMQITRDADIEIFLPGNLGYLRAKGDGKLRMGVDPYGYLTMNGSYVIQTGLFVFSLEQLVSRRFDILEGSSISWTGDIYDAEVSIVARYRLRTDLSGLGITLIDPDAASQKVIVNTDIRMT
ncbi:MAG: hypothetical protein HGA23_00380, partial [Bacteroidales bacterium]|nr:hypothetical protein [Bacteroidales bacterium]